MGRLFAVLRMTVGGGVGGGGTAVLGWGKRPPGGGAPARAVGRKMLDKTINLVNNIEIRYY